MKIRQRFRDTDEIRSRRRVILAALPHHKEEDPREVTLARSTPRARRRGGGGWRRSRRLAATARRRAVEGGGLGRVGVGVAASSWKLVCSMGSPAHVYKGGPSNPTRSLSETY